MRPKPASCRLIDMSDILFWRDSEVLLVTPPGDSLLTARIALSAAAIERDGLPGFLKPLELSFAHASLAGPVAECVGGILEGEWVFGQQIVRQLALPWHSKGPVRLSLQFRNGSTLLIKAESAYCTPSTDARFIESYAC